MNRYLIIGKSPHMCDVFLKDAQGAFRQHKFSRGKKLEITENEMTFHVTRQEAYGLIRVIELDPIEEEPAPLSIVLDEPVVEPEEEILIEEESPSVHIEETESDEAVAPPRKRRKRKKPQI